MCLPNEYSYKSEVEFKCFLINLCAEGFFRERTQVEFHLKRMNSLTNHCAEKISNTLAKIFENIAVSSKRITNGPKFYNRR
jgi:hypothetical protein